MSDDSAFLITIRDQPEDGVLRLVYADWLQDRGDERHELIRVGMARNWMASGDTVDDLKFP